ncbi:MAG: hypothetical protein B7X10_01235, partial [Burkholderiales bacterium 21-58-4]
HTLAAPRLHSDDTTMPLIVGGRGSTKTARLWGYLGVGARRNETGQWVEHPPSVVFEFTDSRESKHPIRFLKHYQGYLQADAYSGYVAAEFMLRRQFRVRICPIVADSSPHIRNDPQTKVASGMSSMKAAW